MEDLKIVDVERNPKTKKEKAGLPIRRIDDEAKEMLADRGFYVLEDPQDPSAPQEIYSKSGDITLQMADGVRYVLRFGVTTGESSAAAKAKLKGAAKSETEDKAKEDSTPGMDRYLFVTVDFNPKVIPKADMKKLPEEKPAEKAPEKPPEEGGQPQTGQRPEKDEPKKDEPKKDEPKKDEPKEDAGPDVKDPATLAAERKQIETDNQREQQRYDDAVKDGKDRVKKLHARFAEWYYLVPGDMYAKIHLDARTS